MGSSGTGTLSDYSDKTTKRGDGKGEGESGKDPCEKAFNALLEDVERCSYYIKHKSLPPRGTEVSVSFSRRLLVETLDGEAIGYLPTAYNYLAGCMKNGRSYGGQVSSASTKPIVRVHVDIGPR
jgi:hypothetical protein